MFGILFDSLDTFKQSLVCMAKMLSTISISEDQIKQSLSSGYLLATEFADYLVKKGVPFRTAHDITGKVVLYAISKKKQIEALSLEEFNQFGTEIGEDVFDYLTMESAIKAKDLYGGTSFNQVTQQLKRIQEENKWNKV